MALASGRQFHRSPFHQPIPRLFLLPRQQHRPQLVLRRQFHKTLVTDQQTETTDFVIVKYITQYH